RARSRRRTRRRAAARSRGSPITAIARERRCSCSGSGSSSAAAAPSSADPVQSHVDDHVEVVCAGEGQARALFTCEHASERLPDPWRWASDDEWIRGTHWAYDLGAADLARELALELDAVAVLSRFSRLLADPNRPEHSPDLCRASAEGRAIQLNAALD